MYNLFSHKHIRSENLVVPDWSVEPLFAFMERSEELRRILVLSVRGSSMVKDLPTFIEIIGVKKSDTDSQKQLGMDELRAQANFAANELSRGHPVLHAHTFVALWAAFETCIEDLSVSILTNQPECLKKEAFAKIKVPLADFESMDKEERMRFLVSELQNSSAGHRHGVDRFERILEPLGLAGGVDDEIKKHLRAFHYLRNVIIHRQGVADRRAVEGCPWLNLKVGQRVEITDQTYEIYDHAIHDYVLTIANRIVAVFETKEQGPTATDAGEAKNEGPRH